MPEFNEWYPGSLKFGVDAVNVKAFGAIGDGLINKMSDLGFSSVANANAGTGGNGIPYPKATSLNDSADWCAIQAAIDYAMDPVRSIMNVFIPEGNYFTTDTIHLGYGYVAGSYAFQCCRLIGAGWCALAGWPTGVTIRPQFVDRPVFNIQGGRESGIRGIAVWGSVVVPDNFVMPLNHRANPANFVPTGAKDDPYAPFCGVCIDAYFGGGDAPSNPYPTPRYPAWVGTPANAYSAPPSSQCFIEDCFFDSVLIGIMQQPWGDSNGDFTKCTRSSFYNCKVAFAAGNSQARSHDFSNMTIDSCHTGFDGCSYGHMIGNLQGEYNNVSTSGLTQLFNVTHGAPIKVTNLYGESNMHLGRAPNVTIDNCHWSASDMNVTTRTVGISSVSWSGGVATVNTSTPLANIGWTHGTADIRIESASPTGYNTPAQTPSGIGTRTGASQFTYETVGGPGSNPGAFVSAVLTIDEITEWYNVPFFTGNIRINQGEFIQMSVYHFVSGAAEFRNVSFDGPQGRYVAGGLLPEGFRKAITAFGRVFITQSLTEACGPAPFSGRSNYLTVPRVAVEGGDAPVQFDGYNTNQYSSLWAIGQKEYGVRFDYDTPYSARCIITGGTWGAMASGVTRTLDPFDIPGVAVVGDVFETNGQFYAVESIGAGPGFILTMRLMTNFKLTGGVYSSIVDPTSFNTVFYPIGVLDLKPAYYGTYPNGLFMKTTATNTDITFVGYPAGSGETAVARPAEIGLKSRPLWTSSLSGRLADATPFPAHTYIASFPDANTVRMTNPALTSGIWLYGPGIKRLK